MLIHCKHCNSKFAINAEEVGIEGRLVKCEHCEKEWFQESKPKYLEKKFKEFDPSGEILRRFFRYWNEKPSGLGSPKRAKVDL